MLRFELSKCELYESIQSNYKGRNLCMSFDLLNNYSLDWLYILWVYCCGPKGSAVLSVKKFGWHITKKILRIIKLGNGKQHSFSSLQTNSMHCKSSHLMLNQSNLCIARAKMAVPGQSMDELRQKKPHPRSADWITLILKTNKKWVL